MELKQIGEALCQLFAITEPKGSPNEVIEAAKQKLGGMPDLLEQFYCTYGLSEELQHLQDNFMLPDRYTMFLDSDYLMLCWNGTKGN